MFIPSLRVPAYCHHKRRDLAYVRLNGEMIYLGNYGSPESHDKYDRILAEWMQAGRTYLKPNDRPGISVNEVLLAYRRHAEQTYVDGDGKPTSEVERVNLAFRPVTSLYGTTPAEHFGPRALVSALPRMAVLDCCRRSEKERLYRIVNEQGASFSNWKPISASASDISTRRSQKHGRSREHRSRPAGPHN